MEVFFLMTTLTRWSVNGQFVFLTYILGVAWLGVFGFSAVPVFLFYNMWSTCTAMKTSVANITNIDSICVDVRQYGEEKRLPATAPRRSFMV